MKLGVLARACATVSRMVERSGDELRRLGSIPVGMGEKSGGILDLSPETENIPHFRGYFTV